jgi:hypothetical protein
VFDFMAPEVGLEPTTLRLTAECSAIELLRSVLERERLTRCAFIVITKYRWRGQRPMHRRHQRRERRYDAKRISTKELYRYATHLPTQAR